MVTSPLHEVSQADIELSVLQYVPQRKLLVDIFWACVFNKDAAVRRREHNGRITCAKEASPHVVSAFRSRVYEVLDALVLYT